MKEFLKKLTSRKFWCALAGLVTGIALAFGADNDSIQVLAGAVTTLASSVSYILAESRVDAAGKEASK